MLIGAVPLRTPAVPPTNKIIQCVQMIKSNTIETTIRSKSNTRKEWCGHR